MIDIKEIVTIFANLNFYTLSSFEKNSTYKKYTGKILKTSVEIIDFIESDKLNKFNINFKPQKFFCNKLKKNINIFYFYELKENYFVNSNNIKKCFEIKGKIKIITSDLGRNGYNIYITFESCNFEKIEQVWVNNLYLGLTEIERAKTKEYHFKNEEKAILTKQHKTYYLIFLIILSLITLFIILALYWGFSNK